MQTTLLKAMPVLSGERVHPNVPALLRRIAKNTWLDEVRANVKCQPCGPDTMAELLHVGPADLPAVEEGLQVLIQRLTPQQRAVVLLCDIFQYTDREAATLLGVSRGAVKAALHRARVRLESVAEGADILCFTDELQKEILAAYVSAFRAADVRMLIHLCQGGLLDPVQATTNVLTTAQRQSEASKSVGCRPVSMLAAA